MGAAGAMEGYVDPHDDCGGNSSNRQVGHDSSKTAITATERNITARIRPPLRCCGLYYGWVIVVCCGLCILCACPAQSYGFALFTEHYIQDAGVPRAALSTIWVTVLCTCSLLLPYLGALSDRIGPRKLLLLVVGPYVGLLSLLGQTRGPVAFCGTFFLTRLVGPGVLVLVGQTTVNRWFVARRGRATAMLNLIMGLETMFPSVALALLAHSASWREAYTTLAFGTGLCLTASGFRAQHSLNNHHDFLPLLPPYHFSHIARTDAYCSPVSCSMMRSHWGRKHCRVVLLLHAIRIE